MTNTAMENGPVEIVDCSIENSDVPVRKLLVITRGYHILRQTQLGQGVPIFGVLQHHVLGIRQPVLPSKIARYPTPSQRLLVPVVIAMKVIGMFNR